MIEFVTASGRYNVISHGNGWAYEVFDNQTGESLWFQDDGASQLQEDTGNFEFEEAIAQYFECLCE